MAMPSTLADIWELAGIFLRLGTVAFGGPAAHIAMMRAEFVERRSWLTESEFLDLIGAANVIPGPSSTEVAIHIGLRRAGWIGLAVAGVCFIVPASLIVTAIAWGYVRFGRLPQVEGLLYGIKPVIIAVIGQALWTLGRTALKTMRQVIVGVLATAGALFGVNPVWLIVGAGYVTATLIWFEGERAGSARPILALIAATALLMGVPILLAAFQPAVGSPVTLPSLFAVFLKIGSIVYGSGYVLLAFLRSALVEHLHWLTVSQLLDATAVGQFTPGPVFTTATFIGYLVAGPAGAVVATIGIFLPAFVLVGISGKLAANVRSIPILSGFMDGVNASSVALMASVTLQLARAAIVDVPTVAIALVAAVLLIRFQVNSAWIVLGGALIGFGMSSLR